jgi:hypothetical protein
MELMDMSSTRNVNASAIDSNLSVEKNILRAVNESTVGLSKQIESLRKDFEKTSAVESLLKLPKEIVDFSLTGWAKTSTALYLMLLEIGSWRP